LSLSSILYVVISACLSVYGFNAFFFIFLYLRHRREQTPCPPLDTFPAVTVQLPIYNEMYVVQRIIDAVARLDWPQDRLQIQVLDDSTDETARIARECVERYRQQGFDITLMRRANRTGFKAGAMNEAMTGVRGEFIAVFDADFAPAPDFLRHTIPHLVADPGLGFAQARWGHLNDESSMLTLAQAIAVDGHFAVEHTARESAGWLTQFNGTAGVWRRQCIEACGGWDGSVLTEDVDLSYRAQLAGWRGRTLTDVVAPAELPAQVAAFKRQQFRWAKGTVQCLLKHKGALARAPISWVARLQGFLHLSGYLAHPLMIAVMLSVLPLIWYDLLDRWTAPFLGLASFGPLTMYTLGQCVLYRHWWRRLEAIPALICIGIGLALNSTVAVAEALLGVESAFKRTPKFRLEGKNRYWQGRQYTLSLSASTWGEVLLALYALLTVWVAAVKGSVEAIPFLLLYVVGFGYVSVLGLSESFKQYSRRQRSRRAPPVSRPAG